MDKRLDNLSARVTPELAHKFKRCCVAHNVSGSEQIERMVKAWVEEQEALYSQLRLAFEEEQQQSRVRASHAGYINSIEDRQ